MKNKDYLKYIINLMCPYKKKIMVLMLLMFLTAAGNMFIPLVQEKIIDIGIIDMKLDILMQLIVLAVMVYVLIAFMAYIQNRIQVTINCDFQKKLQENAIDHLQKIKKDVLDKEGVLKLAKNVDYCVESISQITGNSVLQMSIELVKFIGIIVALMVINWQLALYSLMFIPIRFLITAIIGRKAEIYSKENISQHQKLHQWEDDLYSTIPEIKLYVLYEKRNKEYDTIISSIMKILKKNSLLSAKDVYIGEGLSQSMYMLLYMIAGIMIWKDVLTVGGLLVISSYFVYLINPIDLFSSIMLVFLSVKPAIDKYEDFMSLPEESEKSTVEIKNIKPNSVLTVNNLSFSYGDNKILQKINIVFEEGKLYALVGDNGSGKTTLMDLILRFADIQEGVIRFRNIDIRDYGVSYYRDFMGVVTQQPDLFHATVRNNITLFGKYEMCEEIIRHKLFSFTESLPDGLDSDVGNKATQLSGGEKQKIALARALMKQPSILILDEPTSNYDMESKAAFYELVSDLRCTVIIISHDSEILKIADGIVLLEEGKAKQFTGYEEFLLYGKNIVINE